MFDHAAFIAAILADPEDDLPRLIYADWLNQRGDIRGEFIRLQIHEARGEAAASASHAMAGTFGRQWAGQIASWAYHFEFRRGFVERIVIRGEDFLEHAPAIFRFAPIRRLTLIGVHKVLPQVLRLPHLAHLHGLHLTGGGLSDVDVDKLASCPYLLNLTTLRLGQNGIGSAGLAALAASRHLHRLTQLDLPGNDIGDWGARALAGTRSLCRLERLDLTANALSPEGIDALRSSPSLTRMRQLRVADQRNGAEWYRR